jgi:uncharacterized membrane protein
MDMNEEEEIKKEFQLERIILFTDAVFAIILTIMVLDIKLPEGIKNSDQDGLKHTAKLLALHIIAYLGTFILVGKFWMSHLKLFRYLKDYDRNLLILNLAFLFSVTLFPFAVSALLHELPSEMGKDFKSLSIQNAWGLQIYMTVAMLTVFVQSIVAWYLLRNRERLCIDTTNLENTLEWMVTKIKLFLAPAFLVVLFLLNCLPLPFYTPLVVVIVFGIITSKLRKQYYPESDSGPVISRLYNYAKNSRFRRPTTQNTIKKDKAEQED